MRTTVPTTPIAHSGDTARITRINVRTRMPKAQGGFCGCRTSYQGSNPVSNYAKIVAIDIAKGIFATAITVAGGVALWYTKESLARKLGWKKDSATTAALNEGNEPRELVPVTPTITKQGLGEDIADSIRNGAPVQMFGHNIHEGDRVVFASGPGVGKSIAAWQMGVSIGTGTPSDLFPEETAPEPQRVLLIDAEQDEDDIYLRYKGLSSEAAANITRISDCTFDSPEEVVSAISDEINTWNAKGTVIIDNITSLFSLQSAEKIRKFYRMLYALQKSFKARGHKLTLIIICHEAKSATKLSLKSIQGSGNIGNFATSVFALGFSSKGDDIRYLKVLKARRNPKPGNVYLLQLTTNPYLHFEYQDEVSEAEAIGKTEAQSVNEANLGVDVFMSSERKLSEAQIEELRQLKAQDTSINALAKRYGVNRNTIRKYLNVK